MMEKKQMRGKHWAKDVFEIGQLPQNTFFFYPAKCYAQLNIEITFDIENIELSKTKNAEEEEEAE